MSQLSPLQKFVQYCIILSTCINVANFSMRIAEYQNHCQLISQPPAVLQAEANQPN